MLAGSAFAFLSASRLFQKSPTFAGEWTRLTDKKLEVRSRDYFSDSIFFVVFLFDPSPWFAAISRSYTRTRSFSLGAPVLFCLLHRTCFEILQIFVCHARVSRLQLINQKHTKKLYRKSNKNVWRKVTKRKCNSSVICVLHVQSKMF